MKTLVAIKGALKKHLFDEQTLLKKDFVNVPKSLIPGEWINIRDISDNHKCYLGYINTNTQLGVQAYVICDQNRELMDNDEFQVAQIHILKSIEEACIRRKMCLPDEDNFRLIYGRSDLIPGLIVDVYRNIILIQISTAGVNRFREEIKEILYKMFNKRVVFFSGSGLSGAEILPGYSSMEEIFEIELMENGLDLHIPGGVTQKNGYYFDHRNNRLKFEKYLEKYPGQKKKGLDLFCYIGSWGLHMLRGGLGSVDFVDQGDFQTTVEENIKRNSLTGKYVFHRSDVFKYLENEHKNSSLFDIVVVDPPAFSKTIRNKPNALRGYSKLYDKLMPILSHKSLVVVASCTHGIGFEELSENFARKADKHGKKIQLLDIGIQGSDHPFSSLKSKSFYLKYLLYYLEDI